ncbi:MAG TPA: hypothetical protein VMD92_14500 [Acidobacteriaceae bacterium]|nr:hypothetical protein [Acidobacteriaceae bacterium]
MNNQIPNPIPNSAVQARVVCDRESDSNFMMTLGVVLLVCGGAITGHHEVTMIGLALIIVSSLMG